MSDYDVWDVDKEIAEKASRKIKLKHGMFASVPLVCKGKDCPYLDVCSIDSKDLKPGGRCPIEAGAIVERFRTWCEHFAIDISGETIKREDIADVSLVKDLVENEIQIIRAENKIALNGDFLALTIVDVDKYGDEHKELAATPEVKYKMELQDKRYKILQLLNATRKDKIKEANGASNVSAKGLAVIEKIDKKLEEMNKLKNSSSQQGGE